MTTRLTHLAINADDLDASRRFYGGVLGLNFTEHLGPGFLRAQLDGLLVALQRRRDLDGVRPNGPECTFAVDDARSAAERAEALGGRVLVPPTPVPNVGELTFLADPAGNAIGAMQYRYESRSSPS
jgi:predicted enzyme related to lactoylglutathione lyase